MRRSVMGLEVGVGGSSLTNGSCALSFMSEENHITLFSHSNYKKQTSSSSKS